MEEKEVVEGIGVLAELNVNDFTDKKGQLTYLSWANAWKEFLKVFPTATYEIKKNDNMLPVFGDNKLGYMCYTTVTVGDLTHEMWLPVMDFKNKAMLNPTMFDVNKTVMRCLTKNLAMFGLGLYIYAGEDLPEDNTPDYRTEIWNLIHSDRVPEADREKYINSFKNSPNLINEKSLNEIKAKYFA